MFQEQSQQSISALQSFLLRPVSNDVSHQIDDMRLFLALPKDPRNTTQFPQIIDTFSSWIRPMNSPWHALYKTEEQVSRMLLARMAGIYQKYRGDQILRAGHPWRMWIEKWPVDVNVLSYVRFDIFSNLSEKQLKEACERAMFGLHRPSFFEDDEIIHGYLEYIDPLSEREAPVVIGKLCS